MISSSTEKRQTRGFGAIAFIRFGVLFSLALWRHKIVLSCFFGGLSAIGLGLLLLPSHLKPIHTTWVRLGLLMGKGINILLLSLAYYVVITPAALLKRLFGGRPLPMKPHRHAQTYWVTRSEPAQPRERFLKRF